MTWINVGSASDVRLFFFIRLQTALSADSQHRNSGVSALIGKSCWSVRFDKGTRKMPPTPLAKSARIEARDLTTSSSTAPAKRPTAVSEARAETSSAQAGEPSFQLDEIWNYGVDFWQRSILFWDVLRQRANNMMEQPPVGEVFAVDASGRSHGCRAQAPGDCCRKLPDA